MVVCVDGGEGWGRYECRGNKNNRGGVLFYKQETEKQSFGNENVTEIFVNFLFLANENETYILRNCDSFC